MPQPARKRSHDDAVALAVRYAARLAAPRIDVGQRIGAEVVPSPWLDGRWRVVSVLSGCAYTQLVRYRARSPRFRRLRMAAARLLVLRLYRGSRSAYRSLRAR